jgi:hypothetical protein
MKKLLSVFIILFFGFLVSGTNNQAFAGQCAGTITGTDVELKAHPDTTSHTITIDMSNGFDEHAEYKLTSEDGLWLDRASSVKFKIDSNFSNLCNGGEDCVSVNNKVVTWKITSYRALMSSNGAGNKDSYYVDLIGYGTSDCDVGKYHMLKNLKPGTGCTFEISQARNGSQTCGWETTNSCFSNGDEILVTVTDLKDSVGNPWETKVGLSVGQEGIGGEWDGGTSIPSPAGTANLSFTPNASSFPAKYNLKVKEKINWDQNFPECEIDLTVSAGCSDDQCAEVSTISLGVPKTVGPEKFSLCNQIPASQSDERAECIECVGGSANNELNEGVWTAIGCINRDPASIIQSIIQVGLGMAGGVALITFLAAGFIFSTSQGDPKAYGKAKEMMTSSIVGLLFVIFSVTILQFIGYSIFKIPGFGG